MNHFKSILYCILPYGYLWMVYCLHQLSTKINYTYDPRQTQLMLLCMLMLMGLVLYIVSHLSIAFKWNIIIGGIHTCIYTMLGCYSIYGFMGATGIIDHFEFGENFWELKYMLASQVHLILPVSVYLLCNFVHTLFLHRNSALRQLKNPEQMNRKSHDTWLES